MEDVMRSILKKALGVLFTLGVLALLIVFTGSH